MRILRPLISLFVLLAALWPSATLGRVPASRAQPPPLARDSVAIQAARLLETYTPEERVGQLMLVTFEGTRIDAESTIASLITEYNVGGVLLLAENDNINGQINTPRLVQTLTTGLQQMAYEAAQATASTRAEPRPFTPLFIATTHAGNGLPDTQIAQGTTPLPSLMAIGATWNAAYARQVGQIAGTELAAMGVNMLLGPALDVAQQPQSAQALDLGVNTFGGSPYWVGKLGAAYVEGVHTGGQGRVAVIGQHFPGLGMADTDPDQEIPVIPRTLADLSQIDLVPYAAVADGATSPLARVEGFQCANVRYLGTSARATTNPLCTDSSALQSLLALDSFNSWRADGVVISPSLGSQAIRRAYSTPFNPRQIAREAFWAGSDMLLLDDFGDTPGSDPFANIADVIRFFAERYRSDPLFRDRVDESVGRILRLKLRLYDGDISLDNVLLPAIDVGEVGTFTPTLYPIAQNSATLIAPHRESLQAPPDRDDHIAIFTDVRLVQQCSFCATYPVIAANALELAIEATYGPYGGAQIDPDQVVSFSLSQLQGYLSGDGVNSAEDSIEYKTHQGMAETLRTVDWIVIVILDLRPDEPAVQVIRDLITSDTSPLSRTQVAVITFGAPVYLSATEISKFDAYYALYSHTQPFIDTAVRVLFQESDFPGAPPISLSAAGYSLAEITAPDPDQTIRLSIDSLSGRPPSASLSAADRVPMRIGQQLVVKTSPILDHNGHPVPDGTPVDFTLTFASDDVQILQSSLTSEGIGFTTFTPTRTGRVQIVAASGDARRSTMLNIVVTEESAPSALAGTPPASPGGSASTPAALAGTESDIPAGARATTSSSGRRLDALDLVLALFGLAFLGASGFFVGRAITRTLDGGLRLVLSSVVTGLAGYISYGLGAPGADSLYGRLDTLAPLAVTLGAGVLGWIAAWWALRRSRRA